MGRGVNQMVTFTDLQYMIDNEGFTLNNSFTSSLKLANKADCESALVLDTSGAGWIALASNQMVDYSLLVAGGPSYLAVRVSNSADFDEQTVCAYTAYTTRYCVNNPPQLNDVVYTDSGGTTPYNGGSVRWRHITNYGILVKISTVGVVTATSGACG